MKCNSGIEVDNWLIKWDSMQEYYNPDRSERFFTLISLLKSKYKEPKYILDLGCGTGSLMAKCVEAFPSVHVVGVDLDFTLLHLAKARLAKRTSNFSIIEADLRTFLWDSSLPTEFDAIISATALHWLSEIELANLYGKIFKLLKNSGFFLNADHVGSTDSVIQNRWKSQKYKIVNQKSDSENPWELFWKEYLSTFDPTDVEKRQIRLGTWNGIEDGLPLDWHFEKLKSIGFKHVDCFYRFFSDAIYGGIKEE
jgi:SAM-dependent methyltransferase